MDRLAGRRHGLATSQLLMAAGFSPAEIRWMRHRGILIPVRHGVFRTVGAPLTRELTHLAAVLASGDDAVLSHLSAARMWGFQGFPEPDAIDVLRQGDTKPRGPGIRGHRTVQLPGTHRTVLWRIPITTAERTFFDMCSVVPARALMRSADEMVRRRLITDTKLRTTLDDIPTSGRRAIRPAIAYLKTRPVGFDRGANDRELDVLRVLKRAGVKPLPEQQIPVRTPKRTYRLDFGWRVVKEALEFMGFDGHGNLYSQFHDDADRTVSIQRLGWRLWPITALTTEDQLVETALGIVATIP